MKIRRVKASAALRADDHPSAHAQVTRIPGTWRETRGVDAPASRIRPGAEHDEDRRRKLTALRARLRDDASALRTPADWAGCLRVAAPMPGEDFANTLFVSAQRPWCETSGSGTASSAASPSVA
jgi:hypothetical protein